MFGDKYQVANHTKYWENRIEFVFDLNKKSSTVYLYVIAHLNKVLNKYTLLKTLGTFVF